MADDAFSFEIIEKSTTSHDERWSFLCLNMYNHTNSIIYEHFYAFISKGAKIVWTVQFTALFTYI
jgi:S-methylmethionine-dependent homocysteine/selenocysteine methylase